MKVLVFSLGGRKFALPAAAVRQIDEMAPVTPLPFVPSYVEGLTAVGGNVLPQIDLAARLGMTQAGEGKELIVVAAGSGECVQRIDHAQRIYELPEDELSVIGGGFDGESEAMPRDVVAGEFQLDDVSVVLLRPEAIGIEGVEVDSAESGGALALFGDIEADGGTALVTQSDLLACLEVGLGTEGYAFPLERVSEVYVEPNLTVLPNAPAFIKGLSVRRGVPRVILSLARLLGVPESGGGERVVMTQVADMALGFLCDTFVGIRRYPADRREAAGDTTGALKSYLMGTNGEVVGLIDLEGLIGDRMLEAIRPHYPRTKDVAALVKTSKTRRLLLVRAGSEACGIDVDRVVRVAEFRPPTQVPAESELLLGMVEIGGEVLPVADVARVVGGDCGGDGAYVVVRTDDAAWAVKVSQLERLVDVPVDAIRPAGHGVSEIVAGVGRFGDRLISLLDIGVLDGIPITPSSGDEGLAA